MVMMRVRFMVKFRMRIIRPYLCVNADKINEMHFVRIQYLIAAGLVKCMHV